MHTPEAEARCAESNRESPRRAACQAFLGRLRRVRFRPKTSSSVFDERKVSELIVRWQRTGDEESFAEIIHASLHLINHLIVKYSPQSPSDRGELRSEVILKLASILPKFDPARGRVFTLFYLAIKRFLFKRFEATALRRSREVVMDPALMAETFDRPEAEEEPLESEEFLERLRDLLRPQGWQWRWRWQRRGRLPLPEWRPEWKWKPLGKIAA
jgi:hypothetical protein